MGKIAILLTAGFADWEYAFIAGTGAPFYGLDVQFFGVAAGEVISQGGLTVSLANNLEDLRLWQPDAVVVVGGTIWASANAPDLSALLPPLYNDGTVIAGICGGTLALAHCRLLNAVRHTSNERTFLVDHAPDYQGADYYVESAGAVTDQRLITAPGTAPISFTAAIFASVGLPEEQIEQFCALMAAEHGAAAQ
ncbi:DJ-1/PfpI family protein [Sphingopyxis sp. MWB1]|uniref:DJ-1/PfpI family protein n=1 Tax=Sphingopyxis sp. MWB1 TaxID=1537715 RepID=UPI00051A6D18|nr:DJ-1/PfpI family protein [Sphingopyxis sp. MWB1]